MSSGGEGGKALQHVDAAVVHGCGGGGGVGVLRWWQQGVRAGVFVVQFAVGYLVMLLAMYYNGEFWFFRLALGFLPRGTRCVGSLRFASCLFLVLPSACRGFDWVSRLLGGKRLQLE